MVVNSLKHECSQKEEAWKREWSANEVSEHDLYTNGAAIDSFDRLIRQLNEQKKLPAIVFRQVFEKKIYM